MYICGPVDQKCIFFPFFSMGEKLKFRPKKRFLCAELNGESQESQGIWAGRMECLEKMDFM